MLKYNQCFIFIRKEVIYMNSYDEPDAIRTMDTNSVLTNTFFRMFLGLLASVVAAVYAYY